VDTIHEIERLKLLLDQGAISEEEFSNLKKMIIDDRLAISIEEKKTTSEPHSLPKKRFLSFKKILLFSVHALIAFIVYWGIKNSDNIIQRFFDEVAKNDNGKSEYVYESGKEIGEIVKVEMEGSYPHMGANLVELNVPNGKMWTPLYIEQIEGIRENYSVEVFHKTRFGFSYNDYYNFTVNKDRYVSVKNSKQNNESITGQGQVAVSVSSFAESRTVFAFYFYEESL